MCTVVRSTFGKLLLQDTPGAVQYSLIVIGSHANLYELWGLQALAEVLEADGKRVVISAKNATCVPSCLCAPPRLPLLSDLLSLALNSNEL